MALVTGPLLSLSASGTIADTMTFSRWKGRAYVRQRVIPTYTNTTLQANVRDLMRDLSVAWKLGSTVGAIAINSAYKIAYDTAASGLGISGFNLFAKETVALNDGSAYDGSLAIRATPL